jgi:hypothetical protein
MKILKNRNIESENFEKVKILKSKRAKNKSVEVKVRKNKNIERRYMRLLRNRKDIVVVMIMIFL